jgi:DNA-binding response OmpR family regulator
VAEKRVMIVEDELIPALDLRRRIERAGAVCTGTYIKAEQALEAFKKDPVDMVFLDIYLAGDMDGIELAGLLLSHAPADIVFISASDDSYTMKRIESVEYRAFISKPYNISEILALID